MAILPHVDHKKPLTIRERVQRELESRGMFESQAREVVAETIAAPENKEMLGRWDDLEGDYPPLIVAIAINSACVHALKWIDKNIPQAWYRPMFDAEQLEKILAEKKQD